jgi:hypothetical protein
VLEERLTPFVVAQVLVRVEGVPGRDEIADRAFEAAPRAPERDRRVDARRLREAKVGRPVSRKALALAG